MEEKWREVVCLARLKAKISLYPATSLYRALAAKQPPGIAHSIYCCIGRLAAINDAAHEHCTSAASYLFDKVAGIPTHQW